MLNKIVLNIGGMRCEHCPQKVHDAIARLEGVKAVNVNLEKTQAEIDYDSDRIRLEDIKEAVIDAGHYTILE